ncbi:MAG: ABC transporter permease [Nitrososphaerales archaeon]
MTIFLEQLQRSFAIAKKDIRIYYSKGPVIVFGLIFPLFLFLAFTIGRNVSAKELFPGLIGMVAFFTATSVGPAILPWETRSKTLERLVCSPISTWAIFFGDILASFIFGLFISLVPLVAALIIGVEIMDLLVLSLGMILATFCFASLSVLLSVYPPTDIPSTVMMLSSLIKFPLVFISGVFMPLEQLPEWGKIVASFSPLTYFTDLARYAIEGISHYSVPVDLTILVAFTIIFLVGSVKLHERFLPQRFS